MSDTRAWAIGLVLDHEGGYVDHPDDPGGATNFGITEATARRNGYTGDMRDLTREQAIDIYANEYWDDAWDDLPEVVAFQVFDGAVNSGRSRSVKWLQQAVGAEPDGVFGPLTLAAVLERNEWTVVARYNAARLRFMTDLSTWDSFGRGWARRIAGNLAV